MESLCPSCGVRSSGTRERTCTQCRFTQRVEVGLEHWLWTGGLDSGGYGSFWTGVVERAHVFAYRLWVGPIPDGDITVDHHCKVRTCVRPDHLRLLTRGANVLAGDGPTAVNGRKTHCVAGHEFSTENTYIRPDTGGRQCLACKRSRALSKV